MEIVRYIIVFFTIAWGGAALAALLFLITASLLSSSRQADSGRIMLVALHGVAMFAAVLASYRLSVLTGQPPTYAMYTVAFAGIVLNDQHRIRRAKEASEIRGYDLTANGTLRAGVARTEIFQREANITAFVVAVIMLPMMDLI